MQIIVVSGDDGPVGKPFAELKGVVEPINRDRDVELVPIALTQPSLDVTEL